MKRLATLLFVLWAASNATFAQVQQEKAAGRDANIKPFVFEENGALTGFSDRSRIEHMNQSY